MHTYIHDTYIHTHPLHVQLCQVSRAAAIWASFIFRAPALAGADLRLEGMGGVRACMHVCVCCNGTGCMHSCVCIEGMEVCMMHACVCCNGTGCVRSHECYKEWGVCMHVCVLREWRCAFMFVV
jgi:hypothetical protein